MSVNNIHMNKSIAVNMQVDTVYNYTFNASLIELCL